MAEQELVTGQPTRESAAIRWWLGEIDMGKKREKDYRKEGDRVLQIYGGKKKDSTPFNILYSNTETLLPALYGAVPRPVVQRRFKDADPLGKLSAQAATRGLEYFMDTNMEDYASFDSSIQDGVLDALLPGRGMTRVKYEPVIEGVQTRVKTYEAVCTESIPWDRVILGFCKKWVKLPWLALEHHLSKEQAEKTFGKAVAGKLTFTKDQPDGEEDRITKAENTDGDDESSKTATVYEIWDKAGGKKVRFVAPSCKDGFLKEEDDPLGLSGFFPVPEPLRFLKKSNDQLPVAIYALYENQAKELNTLTVRINKLIAALKVRGVYDSTITEIEDVMKSEENTLVPANNVAALQDSKGIEHAIWLMPIEKIVLVVKDLYIARQQCKTVVYEITGISDILRGQSVASETATAQEIKNQWGTLRLKRMQKEVQRYCREILRIALEIMGKHFSEQTWAAMTGLPFVPTEQKQQAQMMLQMSQQLGMPPDPKMVQAAQSPSWGEVLGLLKNNQQRSYRIDIETNSTVELEATEDQKNISEALQAVSMYLQGVTPLIISGSMPFQAAQTMLLTIVRRFRFGPELEDQIMQMKPPTPPDAEKGKLEQQKMAAEEKRAQQDHELALKEKGFEAQLKEKELAQQLQLKEKEHAIKMEELAAKAEFNKLMAAIKLKEAMMKMAMLDKQMQEKQTPPAKDPNKESSGARI